MTTQYGQYTVPPASEMVNFGVGQPANNILNLDMIKRGMQHIIDNVQDNALLQYGDIPGYNTFRESLSTYLEEQYGAQVGANNLFMTNGVTQALSLICSLFAKRNQQVTLFVEDSSYFLAINIFQDFGLNVVPINMTKNGIDLDVLRLRLAESYADIKILYTIPTFHNPTGITLSHKKRQELAELADQYDLLIVADEVYQLLYFEDKPPNPMCYYYSKTLSLGSFSKILAPSLRLGWIQTFDTELMDVLKGCGQLDSSGGLNPISMSIVHPLIDSGELDNQIQEYRRILKERCDALADSVDKRLVKNGYASYTRPTGGYFLWLECFPDSEDVPEFNIDCLMDCNIHHKVKAHPGYKFCSFYNDDQCGNVSTDCDSFIRLSFSYYDKEDMDLGVSRLQQSFDVFTHKVIPPDAVLVSVLGASGRLGSQIVNEIQDRDMCKMQYHGCIDRSFDIPRLESSNNKHVIIDVSQPEGTFNLLQTLTDMEYYPPVIIGTTGDLPHKLIEEYSTKAPVALVSNFSAGIPELKKMLTNLNVERGGWMVTIEETHHVHKKDKPSGTAKSLGQCFQSIPNIQSYRVGEVIGVHTVTLENDHEIVEITHRAKNRQLFASGAIKYIEELADLDMVPCLIKV